MSWIAVIVIVIELVVTIVLHVGDFGLPELATVLFVLTTALVGLLTARRVHDNPIGRLLLAAAVAYATGGLAVTLIDDAAIDPQNPLFAVAAIVGNLAFGLGFGILATFVLLLFPTGRLPSPRWAIVGWMAGVGLALLLLGIALSPETFAGLPIENPIGVQNSQTLLLVLEGGGIYLLFAAILASVASMVVRFRRGTPIERQQFKWVVLSVLVMAGASGLTLLWEIANGQAEVSDDLENVVVSTTLALIPLAIGIAIQRYRLYDIDRIVSRTVTYGLVSASLLAVYAVLVFVLTDLIRLQSGLAVAAATLGVAALFTPLRRRLQALIDRRFNRSGQNAVRTFETFTARLPSKVDLLELTRDVRSVVGQTMQPAMLSLWLRGEAD